MSRGFLDKVMGMMGIQGEAEDSEEAASSESLASDPRQAEARPKGRLISLPGQHPGRNQIRMVVVGPRSFEEVQEIAEHLKNRRPVIVSLENVDREVAKRVVDFVSGCTYALDGSMQRVGDGIFLFAPSNVVIDADTALEVASGGTFTWGAE